MQRLGVDAVPFGGLRGRGRGQRPVPVDRASGVEDLPEGGPRIGGTVCGDLGGHGFAVDGGGGGGHGAGVEGDRPGVGESGVERGEHGRSGADRGAQERGRTGELAPAGRSGLGGGRIPRGHQRRHDLVRPLAGSGLVVGPVRPFVEQSAERLIRGGGGECRGWKPDRERPRAVGSGAGVVESEVVGGDRGAAGAEDLEEREARLGHRVAVVPGRPHRFDAQDVLDRRVREGDLAEHLAAPVGGLRQAPDVDVDVRHPGNGGRSRPGRRRPQDPQDVAVGRVLGTVECVEQVRPDGQGDRPRNAGLERARQRAELLAGRRVEVGLPRGTQCCGPVDEGVDRQRHRGGRAVPGDRHGVGKSVEEHDRRRELGAGRVGDAHGDGVDSGVGQEHPFRVPGSGAADRYVDNDARGGVAERCDGAVTGRLQRRSRVVAGDDPLEGTAQRGGPRGPEALVDLGREDGIGGQGTVHPHPDPEVSVGFDPRRHRGDDDRGARGCGGATHDLIGDGGQRPCGGHDGGGDRNGAQEQADPARDGVLWDRPRDHGTGVHGTGRCRTRRSVGVTSKPRRR